MLLLLLLIPTGAQAHEVSGSAARAEAAFYAETLVEDGPGTRYRVYNCRRHSGHAVSCAYRIYGPGGYRCGGRVRTAAADSRSYDTISRVVSDTCD
jgi:hypothetical protein